MSRDKKLTTLTERMMQYRVREQLSKRSHFRWILFLLRIQRVLGRKESERDDKER